MAIAPSREPSVSPPTTADQLSALPRDGQRRELIEGALHTMTPAGGRHGAVASTLHGELYATVRAGALGRLFAAETGFVLRRDPDTVRAPDVAFIAAGRLPAGPPSGFPEVVPDLVAEVMSPSDRPVDVRAKALAWLDAGVRLIWVVDPSNRTVTVHRPVGSAVLLTDGSLSGEDVVPGFEVPLARLWD